MFFSHRCLSIITQRDQALYEQRERFTKERERNEMAKNGITQLLLKKKIKRVIKFLDDPQNAEVLERHISPWYMYGSGFVYEVAKRMAPFLKNKTFDKSDVNAIVSQFCHSPDCLLDEMVDLVLACGGRFNTDHIRLFIEHGARENEIRSIGKKCEILEVGWINETESARFTQYLKDGLFKITTV